MNQHKITPHRASYRVRPYSQSGFTILELIVVFFFFALLSGLALPNLQKAYNAWQRNFQKEDLLINVNHLNLSAIETNQIIVLSGNMKSDKLPFALPENWQLLTANPIYYYPNGVCSGGVLIMKNNSVEYQYELQAPYCQPKEI